MSLPTEQSVQYWPSVDTRPDTLPTDTLSTLGGRYSTDRHPIDSIGRVLIGCRSVEYRPSVDRVSVGRVSADTLSVSTLLAECLGCRREATDIDQLGRVSIGCGSVEYWPGVDRVSVGRVLAECR